MFYIPRRMSDRQNWILATCCCLTGYHKFSTCWLSHRFCGSGGLAWFSALEFLRGGKECAGQDWGFIWKLDWGRTCFQALLTAGQVHSSRTVGLRSWLLAGCWLEAMLKGLLGPPECQLTAEGTLENIAFGWSTSAGQEALKKEVWMDTKFQLTVLVGRRKLNNTQHNKEDLQWI